MGNRNTVTIKDIAHLTALSPATVHLVLAGKPGPKAETRERVLSLAKQMGYRCNAAASSLKRGITRIGAVLPRQDGDNQLYYAPIWSGVHAFMEGHADFSLELVEFAYESCESISVPASVVKEARQMEKLSGLIVLGDVGPAACAELLKYKDYQIPIVLVNSDMQGTGRICCVQTDNYLLGRVIGEILLRQITAGGTSSPVRGNGAHRQMQPRSRALWITCRSTAPDGKYISCIMAIRRRSGTSSAGCFGSILRSILIFPAVAA